MDGIKQNNVTKPVIKIGQPDDSYKIKPLPSPSGKYPYHLTLPRRNHGSTSLSFNMVGDTGGLKSPTFQRQIAEQMGEQTKDPENPTEFLYHLGDIVYHFGEREQYITQFFKPYASYPAPIYAIAGNHDADVNPHNPVPYQSLEPFTSVFCDVRPGDHYFSDQVTRKNQRQPNVYWTLNADLVTIIGLYSNVPKYGYVSAEQGEWFVKELIRAKAMRHEKAIIVCLHHAPYTADTNHGSSKAMIDFLDASFEKAGVLPDAVFSGHVHNYQRFAKTYPEGATVPFIVAGSGGFDELHVLATTDNPQFTQDDPRFENVTLERYSLNQHGFLKISLNKDADKFTLTGEYYTLAHEVTDNPKPPLLHDSFTIDLKRDEP
ncbi:metallophosphoesterase family protein [Pedobacter sp.]|uniref:metallophosphoesterase family protein n=1 Tax=Pedobacter sp. TaxID=1411316 RepID=UPI003D7FE43B